VNGPDQPTGQLEPDDGPALSELYDEALPQVYGYLLRRCGSVSLAEDLTSATFVKAASAIERRQVHAPTVGWLITIARHKLVDHWRHQAVVERSMTSLEGGRVDRVEPWEEVLDAARATAVLAEIDAHYRMVLTLRYLDDLSVPETAAVLNRSVRSTESLLARARKRFRSRYEETGGRHD